jgi:transposase
MANTLTDFWEQVEKSDSCWLWTGAVVTRRSGGEPYGRFRLDGQQWMVHRLSWTLANDKTIPPGRLICHHCDTPLCVRPAHLYLGDVLTNARDREARGRREVLRGDRHPHTRLREADVIAIRTLAKTTTVEEIAWRYGLSLSTASRIIRGETWAATGGEKRESLGVGRPSKLSSTQIADLLAQRTAGVTQRQLAERFGLAQSAVSALLSRHPVP